MVTRTMFILGLIIVAAIAGGLGFYLGGALKTTSSTTNFTLNGAGATFPYPLISAMSLNYSRQYPNVQINYNAIGSGGGVNALIQKTVDFAGSDAPLTDTQRGQASGSLHIPETIGAVVAAYNVAGIPTGLNLTGPVLAKIFQGNITLWNAPEIVNLNPGVNFTKVGSQTIVGVHRSDGSGTTKIFTSYLNSTGIWKLGVNTALGTWPGSSLGASGNAGVAGVVQGTKNTIGYVELNYALCPSRNAAGCTNVMSVAYVQNHDGNQFVQPTLANVTNSVSSLTASLTLPTGDASWKSVSLLNAPGTNSYPIVSFTYLLVYKELNVVPDLNKDSATALVNFLWWVVHQGQGLSAGLFYVPLPQSVVTVDETTIRSITYNGVVLHP